MKHIRDSKYRHYLSGLVLSVLAFGTTFLVEANNENGKKLYESKCLNCHGAQGKGDIEATNGEKGKGQGAVPVPILAGQFDWYTKKQLEDFKSKKREKEGATAYMSTLSSEDMDSIASYLESLGKEK